MEHVKTATYNKYVETDENAELWFHHGLLDPKTGNQLTQIIPGYQVEQI